MELLSAAFPGLTWHPSELDEEAVATLRTRLAGLPNVAAPAVLDASSSSWGDVLGVGSVDVMLAVNLLHISPFAVSQGVAHGAGQLLRQGGLLFLYGPFKQHGEHTTASNAAFDASLRARNAAWGYRDIDEVAALCAAQGVELVDTVDMPANNFLLVLRKR